jgi:ankyrin repeat protein
MISYLFFFPFLLFSFVSLALISQNEPPLIVQERAQILSAIRRGHLNDFLHLFINHPSHFRNFNRGFWLMALNQYALERDLDNFSDRQNIFTHLFDGLEFHNEHFDEMTPLIFTALHGSKQAVMIVLRVISIDFRNLQGRTALMICISHGLLDMATFLIDQNARLNCRDDGKRSALHFASEIKDSSVRESAILLLLKRGARVSFFGEFYFNLLNVSNVRIVKMIIPSNSYNDLNADEHILLMLLYDLSTRLSVHFSELFFKFIIMLVFMQLIFGINWT